MAKHFAIDTASYGILDRDPGHGGHARIVQWNITAQTRRET